MICFSNPNNPVGCMVKRRKVESFLKKIPELMKGIGRGTREFKKGLNTDEEDDESSKDVAKKE